MATVIKWEGVEVATVQIPNQISHIVQVLMQGLSRYVSGAVLQ